MKKLLSILLLTASFIAHSQTYRKYDYLKIQMQVDSLKAKKLFQKEMQKATDKEKAMLYLIASTQFDENIVLFKSYINKAHVQLKKEPTTSLEYAYYYNMLSIYYYRIEDTDNYNKYFNLSNSIFVKHREYDALALQYRNKCISTRQPELIKHYLESLKQYAEKSNTALSLFYYQFLSPYFLSEQYVVEKKGDKKTITQLYDNAYRFLLRHQKEIPASDQEFFLLTYANYIITVTPNEKNKLNTVFHHLDNLFRIYNDVYYNQMYVTLKADLMLKDQKPKEAENLLLSTIEKNKKLNLQNSVLVNEMLYGRLKQISQKAKNYDAYIHYDEELTKYHLKADSITVQKSIYNALAKAKVVDEQEKVRILNEKNVFRNLLFVSVSICFILVVAFLLSRWRRSAKENLRLAQEKEKQDQQLLQLAFQIEKKEENLALLKTKMKESNYNDKNINQFIEDIFAIDDDFEKFRIKFEYAYPQFFQLLQKKADNQLTATDLRYLVYTFLDISVKDIANQMNVEPKSIHMARYRIKQKLNLDKDESLDDYIKSIKAIKISADQQDMKS